jgi:hypothetical protein
VVVERAMVGGSCPNVACLPGEQSLGAIARYKHSFPESEEAAP